MKRFHIWKLALPYLPPVWFKDKNISILVIFIQFVYTNKPFWLSILSCQLSVQSLASTGLPENMIAQYYSPYHQITNNNSFDVLCHHLINVHRRNSEHRCSFLQDLNILFLYPDYKFCYSEVLLSPVVCTGHSVGQKWLLLEVDSHTAAMPKWPEGRTPERTGSPGVRSFGRRWWPGGRIPGRTGSPGGRSSARQIWPGVHTPEHTGWPA